jgi:hypothetical protein
MKRLGSVLAIALLALVFAVPAGAQSAGTPNDPHHPVPPAASPATPPATPGAKDVGMPMMDMCRQMMGDTMGMPAMTGGLADPKERAAMLEMRGEMMKAMGDVMMKHARRMHGMTTK